MMRILKKTVLLIIVTIVGAQDSPWQYYWPFVDLGINNYVNGTYGEVRSQMVSGEMVERHHIHNGVDIDPLYGSINSQDPIYIVYEGDEAIVTSIDGTVNAVTIRCEYEPAVFYYYTYKHLYDIRVEEEQWIDYYTILGFININDTLPEYNHLHFCDGNLYGQESWNPLDHIMPYLDTNAPKKDASFNFTGIKIVDDATTNVIEAMGKTLLRPYDKVDIIIKAYDEDEFLRGVKLAPKTVILKIKDEQGQIIYSNYSLQFTDRESATDWDVNMTYAMGSKSDPSGEYYYIATNKLNENGYWEVASNLIEGNYTIELTLQDIKNHQGGWNETVVTDSVWIAGSPRIYRFDRNKD